MRFYDREKELRVLGEVLHRSKYEAKMTVLMGRRRIGKTELSLRSGDETVLYCPIIGQLAKVHLLWAITFCGHQKTILDFCDSY